MVTIEPVIFHNPPIKEVPMAAYPTISESTVVGTGSMVIGDVIIADDVFIGFYTVIRADSAFPYLIGARSNIQDFVHIHSHPSRYILADGRKLGVYIGEEVTILQHTAIHGPLYIGHNTFVGQQVSLYGAIIGANCLIMHRAVILNDVRITAQRYVAPGQVISCQAEADRLPPVPESYENLNAEMIDHYLRLGKSYQAHTPLVSGIAYPENPAGPIS